jgi:hypothetical protein
MVVVDSECLQGRCADDQHRVAGPEPSIQHQRCSHVHGSAGQRHRLLPRRQTAQQALLQVSGSKVSSFQVVMQSFQHISHTKLHILLFNTV